MNKETITFIDNNINDIQFLLEDLQYLFNSNKSSDKRTNILLHILSESILNKSINEVIEYLKSKIENESTFNTFKSFIEDNNKLICDYNSKIKQEKFSTPNLLDIEWKFISTATLEEAELGNYNPKILLKLILDNGEYEILESDYGTFKKLQEELENTVSGFNSSYVKKIEAFSK